MTDEYNDDARKRALVNEMAAGTHPETDTDMPMPPDTVQTVGTGPIGDAMPGPSLKEDIRDAKETGNPNVETGEEPDPGDFNSGGVSTPDN